MYNTEMMYFYEKIDCWVLDSIRTGITNFEDILTSLPGVYPVSVRDSIQRLVSRGILSPSLIELYELDNVEKSRTSSKFPSQIPHPLDFDWRFSRSTTLKLLRLVSLLTSENDRIALLGTPSLLEIGLSKFRRHFIFLDRNLESQSKKNLNFSCFRCDVLRDSLPQITAKTVLADPPWYPEYMHGFMWAASKITKIGGYALFCLPPEGTRPSVASEISEFIAYAKSLGFNLLRYVRGNLSYSTPLFEINALRAEGIRNIGKDWRQGDLALFYRVKKTNIARSTLFTDEEWTEIKIMDSRIKLRSNKSKEFRDPRLISIVPNDVLPSVSRRDNRRKLADVWTSGNRVYTCNGTNILAQIILARSINLPPIYMVSTFLKRNLTIREIISVSSTAQQIDELINREQKEIDEHYFN